MHLFQAAVITRAELDNLRMCRRLSGDDIAQWLADQSEDLSGWWMCYNPDDTMLRDSPRSCLASLGLPFVVAISWRVNSSSGTKPQ